MWLCNRLYIVIVCVTLHMWLHYILCTLSLCALPLQMWLHYILHTHCVCITFADAAALAPGSHVAPLETHIVASRHNVGVCDVRGVELTY